MKPTHIEHLGIAVKSPEESIPYYESLLGTSCYLVEEIKDQRVKTAFFLVYDFVLSLNPGFLCDFVALNKKG